MGGGGRRRFRLDNSKNLLILRDPHKFNFYDRTFVFSLPPANYNLTCKYKFREQCRSGHYFPL